MIWQMDHQVRHVYMNVPHSNKLSKTWYGESVGHFDGDTLVVDTVGLNDKTDTDRFGTPWMVNCEKPLGAVAATARTGT